MSILRAELVARPLAEWHEDIGPVLWWKFPISEEPYCGTPNDTGNTVEVHTHAGVVSRFYVGGWPGYHTHWTPLIKPLVQSDFTLDGNAP